MYNQNTPNTDVIKKLAEAYNSESVETFRTTLQNVKFPDNKINELLELIFKRTLAQIQQQVSPEVLEALRELVRAVYGPLP